MLPLRSAQSTPPNARWVPNARVLILQNRSTFSFGPAFWSQLYRKKVWDEAVSLSLCFEHCYNQKQHISRAYCFGPDQLRSKSQHATTCQNHSPGFTSQIIHSTHSLSASSAARQWVIESRFSASLKIHRKFRF